MRKAHPRGIGRPITPTSHSEPPDDPFEEVITAARDGAPWAFRWLFDSYAGPLAGFLRARGAPDPEGTVNEVFLRVFRSVDEFEGDDSGFRAWVFTIARNLLIDERRRRQRRPETTDIDATSLAHEPAGDVEVEAFERFGAEWVHEALADLSPDQRDVLLLRIVGDLKITEVAEVLGKRPGAVKALQRRGLSALKRKMQQEGVSR